MRSALLSVLFLAASALCGRIDSVEYSKLGRGYKLMYDAESWQDAKKSCAGDGGKLAAPKSKDEFTAIQGLVRGMQYKYIRGNTGSMLLAWLGVSNEDDYTIWKNVDGEDIETTGYSTWVRGNGHKSSDPREPHCAVVDAVNPGLRSYWCHNKQPYVCEFNKDSA